jgi:hypothetical protein
MEKATSATYLEQQRGAPFSLFFALSLAALAFAPLARAQQDPEIRQILDRLDRLERQNVELRTEVQDLRKQLAMTGSPEAPSAESVEKLADSVAVQSTRIEEQAQSKVESLQRFPIRITGMLLFNAYTNSRSAGAYSSPIATSDTSARSAGGTLSQSILGLEFFGPGTFLGGKIRGNIQMDFYPYGGSYTATPPAGALDNLTPRLRTGALIIDWGSRSLMVGREKPLIAQRDPDSLAQVGLPPLSGAGNLWDWQPQIRLEQNFHITSGNTVTAQAALYSTHETNTQLPDPLAAPLEPARPGWEGRVEFAHRRGDEPYFELAPGFHYSVSHVAGDSIASQLVTLDGLFRPIHLLEFSGAFFGGQNAAGLGGLGPGFRVTPDGEAYAVNSRGGWLQMALFPTQRLSLHFFGGAQVNRHSDLVGYYPQSNISFAGNVYYRLAPNVFLAFEAAQVRTAWTSGTTNLRNHYDLALAYKF